MRQDTSGSQAANNEKADDSGKNSSTRNNLPGREAGQVGGKWKKQHYLKESFLQKRKLNQQYYQ